MGIKYIITIIIAFVLSFFTERMMIPLLKKGAQQPIYTEGPEWHTKKEGTPTMGGLAFIFGITAALVVVCFIPNGYDSSLVLLLIYAMLNGAVGIFDDIKKLKKKNNQGLSPKEKLILQFASALIFLTLRNGLSDNSYTSMIVYALILIAQTVFLVGVVNFVNLTDGIDGLAASVTFTVATVLLGATAVSGTASPTVFAAASGGTLAFLFFNINPAKIFMGDTGSLFLGGLIGGAIMLYDSPFTLIPALAVFIIEGASVIIQVGVYKLYKKRVFRMAPLHHHLEKCGWNESKICMVALIVTLLFSIPAFIIPCL